MMLRYGDVARIKAREKEIGKNTVTLLLKEKIFPFRDTCDD